MAMVKIPGAEQAEALRANFRKDMEGKQALRHVEGDLGTLAVRLMQFDDDLKASMVAYALKEAFSAHEKDKEGLRAQQLSADTVKAAAMAKLPEFLIALHDAVKASSGLQKDQTQHASGVHAPRVPQRTADMAIMQIKILVRHAYPADADKMISHMETPPRERVAEYTLGGTLKNDEIPAAVMRNLASDEAVAKALNLISQEAKTAEAKAARKVSHAGNQPVRSPCREEMRAVTPPQGPGR